MKRFVALCLFFLTGCSQTQVAVTPTPAPPVKAPPPRVVNVKPTPTPTFMPVSSTGLPTMPGQVTTAPQVVVRRAPVVARVPIAQAQQGAQSGNSQKAQISRNDPAVQRQMAMAQNYVDLSLKWQKMLIGSIDDYRAHPSRETALVISANVDAIWNERIVNFMVPPAFMLADSLLGQGLRKLRSAFRNAEWGARDEANQDIDDGIRLVLRSWKEAARAARSEAKRFDAMP